MNPLIIDILGISGSGKGTQAKFLQEKFGLDYVGTGELLRVRKQVGDFSGRKAGQVMDRGDFMPTVFLVKLWMDRFEELKNTSPFKGFVLDGSPRKVLEAEILDQAFDWYEWKEYFRVILVDVSEKEVTYRLSNRKICGSCKKVFPYIGEYKNIQKCDACGGELVVRPDDSPEGIKGRIRAFRKEVIPVIKYYEKQGRLIRVNGEQSIEDVHKDILKAFEK